MTIPTRVITEATGFLTTKKACEICGCSFKVGERISWIIIGKDQEKKGCCFRFLFGIVHLNCPLKVVKKI